MDLLLALAVFCVVTLFTPGPNNLYLAWEIASSPPPGPRGEAAGRPIGFLQAAAFQWV